MTVDLITGRTWARKVTLMTGAITLVGLGALGTVSAIAQQSVPQAQAQALPVGVQALHFPTSANATVNAGASQFSATDYLQAKSLQPTVSYLDPTVFDLNAAVAAAGPAVASSPSKAPTANANGLSKTLHAVNSANLSSMFESTNGAAVTPQAVGTGNIQFTSSRGAGTVQENNIYPWSTVGKLFFKIGAATYVCSGSVVGPGVVATAGHCVHSGNNAATGWYTGWQFIPAYRSGVAPFGTWSSVATVYTTTNWYSGGGVVPNLRDWALIVFNRNASGLGVGNYTGWLGWQYPSLIGKEITSLGYPQNLDSGLIVHRTDSLATNGGTNNGTWGADQTGGSSGGPEVLNWRTEYTGQTASTLDNGANRLVSVTSWGYVSPANQVQGASQFDSLWSTLLTTVHTAYPWAY